MENYEKVEKLGSGACGAVFLVRHVHSKKLYALKKIELDEKRKTRTKEAVLKEASILSKLKHPHIVAFHESFFEETDAASLVIIQDYCDGGTLADQITEASNKQTPLEEKQIMQWFIQIIMAVQYIHSNRVLHRDLKTENVFLTKKNVVKIGDFGISKTLENTIDLAKTVVGTPSYLSPELCQDIPYNSKSDIWAVGCVLYEMCVLTPPFDAHNLISLFYKIIKAEFEPIPTSYSVPLQQLTNSILVKNPEHRPSASAILNLPFIKEHLSVFIEEKEDLQNQRVLRDATQLSPSLSVKNATPKNIKHSPKSVTQPFQCKLSPSPRAKRKHTTCLSALVNKNPTLLSPKLKPKLPPLDSPNQTELPVQPAEDVESENVDDDTEQAEYSDDFDESSASEIEEDINVEYDDDFEDSDSDASLEQIVYQAKEAAELQEVDDFFEEKPPHSEGTLTQAAILKKQCIEALGEQKYEDVHKLMMAGTLTETILKSHIEND